MANRRTRSSSADERALRAKANAHLPYAPSADICIFASLGLVRPTDSVLEVGCGTGDDAIYLSSFGCKVVAIDESPAAIHYAQAQFEALKETDYISRRAHARFHAAKLKDLRRIVGTRSQFDVVSDRLVLSNLSNAKQVAAYLDDIGQLLKRGGLYLLRMGFGDPNWLLANRISRSDALGRNEGAVGRTISRALAKNFESLPIRGSRGRPLLVVPMLPVRGAYHQTGLPLYLVRK